tara:strand:+ start:2405 stop:2917 length:513 start_codon:yes stop_codon:yes gene_type:complete
MSTLSVDTIQGQTTAANVKLPAGCILQTVNTILTGTVAVASQTFGDVMSLAITPKYSTSKVLVQVSGSLANNTAGNLTMLHLLRGSTKISAGSNSGTAHYNGSAFYIPTADTYQTGGFAINFLDSPATTNATTYKIQIAGFNGTARIGVRGDSPTAQSMPTYFTLMEIAQ